MQKVNQINDFQTLQPVWNQLLKNNLLGSNVFLTWEWLSTWWKHFGPGKRLMILTVEDQGAILGIAPLMFSEYKASAFGHIRKIELVAARDSDYNNFIILRENVAVVNSIVDYLKNKIPGWDWIELKEIPESTDKLNLVNIFSHDFSSNLTLKMNVCNSCPYVVLPVSINLLMEKLGQKMRQNLTRRLREMRKNYRVELKRYDEAGYSAKQAMTFLARLNKARWSAQGMPGLLDEKHDDFGNFQMDVAERFAEKGWLGLYFLMANDEPISAEYTFEYGRKVYSYLSGFDPSYSKYSVGNLLVMLLLERLIKDGFSEYDMLRGDEPYKFAWTNTYRQNFEIRLVQRTLLSKYYDLITWNKFIVHLTRKLAHFTSHWLSSSE
jgi:CelD/BcsL family acetyltransferase involved in cellulose biosynthesis